MGRRRQAREIALKMLFQIDQGKIPTEEVIHYFLADFKTAPEVIDYACQLTRGVIKELPQLDQLLSQHSQNWKLGRIATVDRTLLRMAAYELLHIPEVPKNVVINETIEIAKKYSTEESGSFINGILDQLLPKDDSPKEK